MKNGVWPPKTNCEQSVHSLFMEDRPPFPPELYIILPGAIFSLIVCKAFIFQLLYEPVMRE